MATNYQGFQFAQPTPVPPQGPQFFPQPQGNIYLINNSLEMANVPTGVGVSAAICLSEGVMYLKTMQNGTPMFVTYRITPFESTNAPDPNGYATRIEALENEVNQLKKKTGHSLSDLA